MRQDVAKEICYITIDLTDEDVESGGENSCLPYLPVVTLHIIHCNVQTLLYE